MGAFWAGNGGVASSGWDSGSTLPARLLGFKGDEIEGSMFSSSEANSYCSASSMSLPTSSSASGTSVVVVTGVDGSRLLIVCCRLLKAARCWA